MRRGTFWLQLHSFELPCVGQTAQNKLSCLGVEGKRVDSNDSQIRGFGTEPRSSTDIETKDTGHLQCP